MGVEDKLALAVLLVWGVMTVLMTIYAVMGEADGVGAAIGWVLLILGSLAYADESGRPPVRY